MISNEVINKCIDYIIENIDSDISVSDVASYCNYSKYYFCRAFKEATGFSIYEFIKRLKMDYSAIELIMDRDKSITEIGELFGYSASNYSTAFKKYYNKSPIQFRNTSINSQSMQKAFEEYDKIISIQMLEDYMVIYERYFGSYTELGKYWRSFLIKYKGYYHKDAIMIEKTYDNPSVTKSDQCMYDICITIDKECHLENIATIKSGIYAVYHFDGFVGELITIYQELLNIWLVNSDYIMDRGYCLDIYRSKVDKNRHVKMDICIPVKEGKKSEVN